MNPAQDSRTAATRPPRSLLDGLCLSLAQGLGSGRLKPGPGTWGSLVGVGLILLLLLPGSPLFFAAATVALAAASIPVCSRAARLLDDPDPGSVVLDEIVAMPLAFSGYAGHWWMNGMSPTVSGIRHWWWALAAAFVLFRLFDIWKPWPIRQLQSLHGGLGIVADDLAAALVTAALLGLGTWAAFYLNLLGG